MITKPTREWIIAAVCESEDNLRQLILCMQNDVKERMERYEFLKEKTFPYEIKFTPIYIPISALYRRELEGGNYFEICIGTYVRASIKNHQNYWAQALLLNRDLLVRHKLGDKFSPIVKNNYFRSHRFPNHSICCYGGIPNEDIRYGVPSSASCAAFSGCNCCNKESGLENCKHTCYWYLVNLMLVAAWPRKNDKSIDIEDERLLPLPPFIYSEPFTRRSPCSLHKVRSL